MGSILTLISKWVQSKILHQTLIEVLPPVEAGTLDRQRPIGKDPGDLFRGPSRIALDIRQLQRGVSLCDLEILPYPHAVLFKEQGMNTHPQLDTRFG
jgi:hypothetical protein